MRPDNTWKFERMLQQAVFMVNLNGTESRCGSQKKA
jgi:hypothetical protein